MSVVVDTKGIVRQWRERDQDSVMVVWRPGTSAADADGVRAAIAAVEAANADAEQEARTDAPTGVHGWEPWPGSRGPVVFVKPADTRDALERWLDRLATALNDEGCGGRIEPERSQIPPIVSDPRPVLTAVLSFDGWTTDARNRAVGAWNVDDRLRLELVEWTVEWASGGGQAQGNVLNLSQGPGRFAMTADAVREAVLRQPDDSQVVWNPDLGRMRSVTFTKSGRLLVQDHDSSASWSTTVDGLRRILVKFSSSISLGVVRYCWSNELTANGAFGGWPPRYPRTPAWETPASYYIFQQNLDSERVPDASGVQLLTDDHLARVRNVSHWAVTPVAAGRYLVEVPNLAPWFENDQPDPDVLAAAREDFADVILWTQPT